MKHCWKALAPAVALAVALCLAAAPALSDATATDATETDILPARAYVHIVAPASNIDGWLPLPEEGEVVYPLRQVLPDGTLAENVVRLTPEGVCMESSNCENQDCVHEGMVTIENHTTRVLWNAIICLPHQVMIELYTREEILALYGSR